MPSSSPPPDRERRARLERILALARLSLALLALVVVQVEPWVTEPAGGFVADLIMAYTAYAILAAVFAGWGPWLFPLCLVLQVTDLIWALAITTTEGPGGTFVFYVFALVSAAYRWGFWVTVLTGIVTAVLLVLQAHLPLFGGLPARAPLETGQLVLRCGYAVGLAALIGYLAEEQNRSHAQAMAAARVLAGVDLAGGLRASLQRVLAALIATFDAARAAMLFEEMATGRTYRWSLQREGGPVLVDELSEEERRRWMVAIPPAVVAWRVRRRRHGLEVLSYRAGRRGVFTTVDRTADLPFDRRAVGTVMRVGGEWTGRLIVFDPRDWVDRRGMEWLGALTMQISPALYSVYLLGRLRSRVTAMERSRLARELHDGLIQSLVGLEMQIDVLRRQAASGNALDVAAVEQIQRQLHDEVITVRELMQEIRPVEVSTRDFPSCLAELADRFRRDTGIETRFVSTLEDVVLPPRLARELLRIAQEALVNVRKHSGASQVVVSFGASKSDWTLAIDDNGRGFGFAGRYTLDELDAARSGPLVIKERVRGVGGSLLLQSMPGHGTSLQISVSRP